MRRNLIKICLPLMVILLAFGTTTAIKFYLTEHIDKLLKTEAAKVSSTVDITWKAVQVRLFHLDVVLHHTNVKASREHQLGIERIILSITPKFTLTPDYVTIRMGGIHFLKIPGHKTNQINKISNFDFHEMKASMLLEVLYDPVLHNLDINKLILSDKNWGQLQLQLVLNHFHPRKIRDFQFEPLLIQTVDLKYQDYALLNQLMDYSLGKNSEFKHFMAEAINLGIEPVKKNNQAQVKSLDVLQNFLKNTGKLTFKMRLRQPVSISQIINARRVSELLEMIQYSFTNA
jgi:hypothetical protein